MSFRPPSGARAAVAALVAGFLAVAPAGPAGADVRSDVDCTTIVATDTDEFVTELPSWPLQEMGVVKAQARLERLGRAAGEGVVVAVIDSGVAAVPGIPVLPDRVHVAGVAPPEHHHGTAVAGLIAGQPRSPSLPVGIAPGAQILDVQVYDDPAAEPGSEGTPVLADNVVRGLDEVIARLPQLNIKVVNISLAVPDSPAMRNRIQRLWKAGVIVVAPTGNRPPETGIEGDPLPDEFNRFQPGENAAAVVHPADYPHVLAVNASMTGAEEGAAATEYVLQNYETDVAAPTAGAVSYSILGGTCVLYDPATSWAAAEVSGVLALLQSAYDEPPGRAVNRLLATANGRPDIRNGLLGAGEVQADAALSRPVPMDDQGNLIPTAAKDEPQRVAAPEAEPDLLAATRRNAVWWGLIGGGVLLLALVLRPVLARRRH